MSLSKEQLQELPGRGESVVMVRLTAARPGPRGGEARRGQTGAKTQQQSESPCADTPDITTFMLSAGLGTAV